MKTIMRESMPRWYAISWDAAETAIRIRLSCELPRPENMWSSENGRRISMRHGFLQFESDLRGKWFGFDRALEIAQHPSGEYREFIGRLPRVRVKSRRKCFSCEGSGSQHREACFSCDGTGKDYDLKRRHAEALAMSIGLLLSPFEYNEHETGSRDSQLLTVHLYISEQGAPIGGTVGVPLHRWAREYPQYSELTNCTDAMKQAYGRMMGESRVRPNYPFGCRAMVYSSHHHISLDCPGNACGVYGLPDDDPGDNNGYRLSCHNVDNPTQQLTLLTGLAALHDRADREMREQTKTA